MHYNIKAEKALITAIVRDNTLYGFALANLQTNQLSPDSQEIFRALAELSDINEANLVLLTDKYNPVNIEGLDIDLTIRLLQAAAEMKQIKEAAYAIGKSDSRDAIRTLAYGMTHYFQSQVKNMDDVVNEFLSDPLPVIPSYYEGITGGFVAGSTITIGGRPGMGKTTLAVDMAYNYALDGYKVLFVSLEMTDTHVLSKVVAKHLGYRGEDMRDWRNKPHAPNIRRAVHEVRQLPLTIVKPANNVEAILGLSDQVRPDIVFVDYIQLMKLSTPSRDRVRELGDMGKLLQQHGLSRKRTILIVSQLHRGPEGREDKRPTLADLRGSGELEEDTAYVLFPYRPNYHDPELPSDRGEIIVAKNRYSGKTGTHLIRIKGDHFEDHR